MYAAMTDMAVLTNDTLMGQAVDKLWENMVTRKTYITGGIGSRHEGESFGDNYELPNLSSYNETCAAIGSVYWNHRLHSKTGNAGYFDVIERTLYNGLISGLSLDGTSFFYPNALEADGEFKFNRGSCTRQNWFDCSCCPTNLIRFIPAIPGLLYSHSADTIYVNLFAASEATIDLPQNRINLSVQTQYPWDGKVSIVVKPEKNTAFTLKIRIPSWARNQPMPGDLYAYSRFNEEKALVSLNGEVQDLDLSGEYLVVQRNWKAEDALTLTFPMPVRMVESNPLVTSNAGKRSLERGPLVYAIEEMDNPGDFDAIQLDPGATFEVQEAPDLLGGIYTISNGEFTAIPYYSWSNRGIGKMKVWLQTTETIPNK